MKATAKRKRSKPEPGSSVSRRSVFRALGSAIGSLLFGAICSLAFLYYHGNASQALKASEGDADFGVLEQCRQFCEQYGLLPSGRLDDDARAFLKAAKHQPLSDGLREVLADESFVPAESQAHPLLHKTAPEFSLRDDQRTLVTLSELRREGPVLVVFYYGYYCSHCVAQLFGISDDMAHFRELGVQVVAISADSPEETAEKLAEYGRFEFPVLSDPDNAVAGNYGTYFPAGGGADEQLQHGTFVVDRNGQIVWANRGPAPFIDNKSLLYVLARLQGRTPQSAGGKQELQPSR
ncbi:MAG TPA: peroxiredoxin family protein [Pirellulales bacterium]|nr:peroxiredoxin family protein [Pirellulales bacterium]